MKSFIRGVHRFPHLWLEYSVRSVLLFAHLESGRGYVLWYCPLGKYLSEAKLREANGYCR